MKNNEVQKHLNDIAVLIAQHQGLQFNTQSEAQKHIDNTATQLRDMMQQSSLMFSEGLKHLIDTKHHPVADISRQILKNLESPEKLVAVIESQIINKDESLKQFSEAVNSFYGCGDFHTEECVISVLLSLFPLEPQPFACYGTLIWRRDGITAAVEFYKNIVDVYENPILDYFAGDCYFKAGQKKEARVVLERALENATNAPEIYGDIAQFIRILLREF